MKRVLRLFIVGVFLLFAWPFFLYKVYGNKNYKLEGRTIIIANHYSNLDPLFIYLKFFKYHIHFVTTLDVKKNLLTRFVTWLFDCIYVNYNGSNLKFFKDAMKILNNDGILCIFPEGEINPTKFGFFEFYASYIRIAKKTNASILPLYVYPEVKFFKKSKIYVGDIVGIDEVNSYDDEERFNMHMQSLIMTYSLEVNPIEFDEANL